jgi:hypothetical protein
LCRAITSKKSFDWTGKVKCNGISVMYTRFYQVANVKIHIILNILLSMFILSQNVVSFVVKNQAFSLPLVSAPQERVTGAELTLELGPG